MAAFLDVLLSSQEACPLRGSCSSRRNKAHVHLSSLIASIDFHFFCNSSVFCRLENQAVEMDSTDAALPESAAADEEEVEYS